MKNYQTEPKLEVVKSFLAGEGGAKLLARKWSVPEEKIRTWVCHYRLHGIDGLRPKRSAYSAQFKLRVLSHQDRGVRVASGVGRNLFTAAVRSVAAPRDWHGIGAAGVRYISMRLSVNSKLLFNQKNLVPLI